MKAFALVALTLSDIGEGSEHQKVKTKCKSNQWPSSTVQLFIGRVDNCLSSCIKLKLDETGCKLDSEIN